MEGKQHHSLSTHISPSDTGQARHLTITDDLQLLRCQLLRWKHQPNLDSSVSDHDDGSEVNEGQVRYRTERFRYLSTAQGSDAVYCGAYSISLSRRMIELYDDESTFPPLDNFKFPTQFRKLAAHRKEP